MEEECLLELTFHVQIKNWDSDNLKSGEKSQNIVNGTAAVLNGRVVTMTSLCQG